MASLVKSQLSTSYNTELFTRLWSLGFSARISLAWVALAETTGTLRNLGRIGSLHCRLPIRPKFRRVGYMIGQ